MEKWLILEIGHKIHLINVEYLLKPQSKNKQTKKNQNQNQKKSLKLENKKMGCDKGLQKPPERAMSKAGIN